MPPPKTLLSAAFRDRHRDRWNQWTARWGSFIRLFVRPPFPKNEGGKVFVHLGCGDIHHPRFINVDARRRRHVHYIGGVERLPMFRDSSVDLVYSCHCLEHIPYSETGRVLAEWARILKPGGVLRLSVPDFDRITDIFLEHRRDIASIRTVLLGGQGYEHNFHKAAFNRALLEQLLAEAGLTDIRVWQPGSDELTTFNDWSGRSYKTGGKTYPVSLNLEGRKPFPPPTP